MVVLCEKSRWYVGVTSRRICGFSMVVFSVFLGGFVGFPRWGFFVCNVLVKRVKREKRVKRVEGNT